MATALKLKSDIKKLKSAIASKATPKTFIPKLKAQLDKAESELSAISSGAKPRKTSTTKSTKTTLTALQKLIQKKKYGVYKGAGVNLEKDAAEGAFASGRRVSKGLKSNQFGDKGDNKGNVYYEYRPNRLDIKQPKKKQTYPKLEKGGMMAKGGEVRYKLAGNNFGQQIESGKKFAELIKKAHENQTSEHKYPENFIKEIAYTGKIVKNDGTYFLKDYSYKGVLNRFEFLGDKYFLESLKYLNRPTIKNFKFEDGGMMADSPKYKVGDKINHRWMGDGEVIKIINEDNFSGGYVVEFVKNKKGEYYNIDEWDILDNGMMAKGGYMAKGGEMDVDSLKVGDKIGFLRPRTGRYEYANVLSIDGDNINLVVRHPKNDEWDNYFTETKERIKKYTNTESEDWNEKSLMKIKKLEQGGYMADGGMFEAPIAKYVQNTIKDFYINTYPTDDLGQEINGGATFDGLNKVLDCNIDVYEYLGVGDSIVRERVFEKLAEIEGVNYDVIYDKWLASDYADGGMMADSPKYKVGDKINHRWMGDGEVIKIINEDNFSGGYVVEFVKNKKGEYYNIDEWDILDNGMMAKGGYMADGGEVGNFRFKKGDEVYAFQFASDKNRQLRKGIDPKYVVGNIKDSNLQKWAKVEIVEPWSDEKYWETYKVKLIDGHYDGFDGKIKKDEIFVVSQGQLSKSNKRPIAMNFLEEIIKAEKEDGYMAKGGSVNYGRSWTADRAKHNKSEDYEIPMNQRKFDHGGEVGQGFLIRDMREKLNRMFPDTFGFTVGNVSKEGNKTLNSAALIVDLNDPYRGLEDKDIESKLFFPQYKRDHNINFRVMQGGENTYFYFALESEKGDEYIGQFGFKDQGDVSSDYVTRFIAFLMEQYGLPFEVKHSVMAKGGYMAGGGEMHKADYFKDGGKVFSEKELKDILDEALSHFYQGLNQIDLAMRYLEVKGQGGLKTPLSNKLKLDDLRESVEKIDEYISK